jgi:hypothetical protein
MAAPYLSTYSPAALIAAHTALLGVIDGDTNPGKVTIHNTADVLLAEIPLADPGGSVNQTTGALSLTPDGREDDAPAAGTPSYGTVRNGAGTAIHSLPCQQGTEAVPGKCVLNTMSIQAGDAVELISWIIG